MGNGFVIAAPTVERVAKDAAPYVPLAVAVIALQNLDSRQQLMNLGFFDDIGNAFVDAGNGIAQVATDAGNGIAQGAEVVGNGFVQGAEIVGNGIVDNGPTIERVVADAAPYVVPIGIAVAQTAAAAAMLQ